MSQPTRSLPEREAASGDVAFRGRGVLAGVRTILPPVKPARPAALPGQASFRLVVLMHD